MEFRQLHAFLTVAKTANFSRAAQLLGYAQSTITTQIQLLEQEFNTKLFDRLGKQVVLTEQGKCFYRYAQNIVALATEAKNAMLSSEAVNGKISIGVPESLCATRLPKVLQAYGQRYPHVKIVLKMGAYQDFTYMLKNNFIDAALFFQREKNHPQFITTTLVAEPIVAVAAKNHPLTARSTLKAVDLGGQTIILAEQGCSYRIILEEILESEQIEPETILEIGSVAAMTQCAVSGLGIAFLPKIAVERELRAGLLVDLHWDGEEFNTVIQVAYHKDKWLSPALQAFLKVLAANLDQTPCGKQ